MRVRSGEEGRPFRCNFAPGESEGDPCDLRGPTGRAPPPPNHGAGRRQGILLCSSVKAGFQRILAEDRLHSDSGKVAQLNLSFYGTRDVAKNWTTTNTEFQNGVGFKTGHGCSCNFSRRTKQVSLTVHGDDFTASGSDSDLVWLGAVQRALRVKGPSPGPRSQPAS